MYQDIVNINFPSSWFLDFVETNNKDVRKFFGLFENEISHKEYYLTRNFNEFITKVPNIHEFQDLDHIGHKHPPKKMYFGAFKEIFFGKYVDFLLILTILDKKLMIKIKMAKIDMKMGNAEARKRSFENLSETVHDYFKGVLEEQ